MPYCSSNWVLLYLLLLSMLLMVLLILLLLLLVFPELVTANWHVLAAAALDVVPRIAVTAAAAQMWFIGMLCCYC